MIGFQKLPDGKLNKDGSVSGIATKQPEPEIGISTPEFHKQVSDLVNQKVPLDKAYRAIDSHPEIHDKARAKSMASAVYEILGHGKNT